MKLIVDADGLAFKSYYTLEKKIDYPMAYNVIRMMNRILDEYKPDYVAFVFDSVPLELRKIYKGYREGREEPWQLGKKDYELMIDICSYLYPVYKKDGVEADRIIAGLVNNNKRSKILIYSDDKDFFQLLRNGYVELYGEVRGRYTARMVKEEFELDDNRLFRDFLIYTGDEVDRIPRLFSTKDAYEIIETKGIIEDWFFDKDYSKLSDELKELIIKNYNEIERNYKLIDLLHEYRVFKPISSRIKDKDELYRLVYNYNFSMSAIEYALELGKKIGQV